MEGPNKDNANAWVIFAEEESGQPSEVTEKKKTGQTDGQTQEVSWSNQVAEPAQEASWTNQVTEPTQEDSWSNQVTSQSHKLVWSDSQVNNLKQEEACSKSEVNEPKQEASWTVQVTESPVAWSSQAAEPPKEVLLNSLVTVAEPQVKAAQTNNLIQEAESSEKSKPKTEECLNAQTNKSSQEEISNELTIYQDLPTKYTKKEMMNLTYNVDNASKNLGYVAGRLVRVYHIRRESQDSNETGGWRRPVFTSGTRESRDYTIRLSEGEYNEYTKSLIENKITFTGVTAPKNNDSRESSNSSNTDVSNDSTIGNNSSSIRDLANIRTDENGTMRYVNSNNFNSTYTLEVPDYDAPTQRVINIKLLLKPTAARK